MTLNNSKTKHRKNTRNQLKFFYFNAQSLLNKLISLHTILESLTYDIICITETWLNKRVLDALILHNFPYSLVRSDRNSKRGGGSCIIISNLVDFKIISTLNIFDADLVCVDLFEPIASKIFRIINIYCPPDFRNSTNYSTLIDYVVELISVDFHVVIVGDFNVPKIAWATSLIDCTFPSYSIERAILDFTFSHQLTQHINFPTRKNSVLDLLFTNDKTTPHSITSLPPFGIGIGKQSDHNSFSFLVDCSVNKITLPTRKDFLTANYTAINNYLCTVNWQSVFALASSYDSPITHLNAMYTAFTSIINETIEMFVPLKQYRPKHTSYPKHIQSLRNYVECLWQNRDKNQTKIITCSKRLGREVRKYVCYRERRNLRNPKFKHKYVGAFLKTKSRKIPTLTNNTDFLFTETSKCESLSETFYCAYNSEINKYRTDIDPVANTKNLDFIVVDSIDVLKHLNELKPALNISPDSIPEIFLKHCRFSLCRPLTYLFQFMLMIKAIPKIWKTAIISPIPKVLNSPNPIDYRPISLLCPTSKIFEKIIFSKISMFLEDNNIIPKSQHGFQMKKSVVTQLIETYEDLTFAHENKCITDIIYFDLSKAFDSVPHNRLIAKLSSIGIKGALLDLIKDYLTNRTFTVRVGNTFSSEKPAPSGVPQGSVGGPILFIAYISDIVSFCETEGVTIKLFADDIKAYHISNSVVNFNAPLQNFILKFTKYCDLNGLSIACNKCRVLHIGNKNPKNQYSIQKFLIPCVENNQCVRDLGLYFCSNLKWDNHIDIISKKARRTMFSIVKSVKYSNCETLVNLFKTYVRPILEFASNVFNPFLLKDIHSIEKVQKDFLKILYKKFNANLFRENPLATTPTYNELLFLNSLESLELRRLKSDLYLFHKHLHGQIKINCRNPYICKESKTRGEKYKIYPSICKTIVRHNSFFVRTSRIYCLLPIEIRKSDVVYFINNLNSTDLSKYLKCKL